jgi:hypothetical protein
MAQRQRPDSSGAQSALDAATMRVMRQTVKHLAKGRKENPLSCGPCRGYAQTALKNAVR